MWPLEYVAMRNPGDGYAPVANGDLPRVKVTVSMDASPVANPEVAPVANSILPRVANQNDDDDLLDDLTRGNSTGITEIGKGWRLERNSDGRLRWRWQVKDNAGNPITYVKSSGETAYSRGSKYVGITQLEEAEKHDSERVKGRHKPRRGRKVGR